MKHLVLFLAAFCILSTGCRKDKNNKVKYTVTCGSCDLTYNNASGNTEQRSMTSTWNYEFDAEKGQFLYISAQNNNQSGDVSVRIDVGGNHFKSATSNGAYVIATASGSRP